MRDYTMEERNNLQSHLATYQINSLEPREEVMMGEQIHLRYLTVGTTYSGNKASYEPVVHYSASPKPQGLYGEHNLSRVIEEPAYERYLGSNLGLDTTSRFSRPPSRGRGPADSVRFSHNGSPSSMQNDESMMPADVSLPVLNEDETRGPLRMTTEDKLEMSQSQMINLNNTIPA
jgi:hypothetical protein